MNLGGLRQRLCAGLTIALVAALTGLVPQPAVASPDDYTFLLMEDRKPVRWDPCQGPIRVMMLQSSWDTRAGQAFRYAIQQMREATGLDLRVGGTTDYKPRNTEDDAWTDRPRLLGGDIGIALFDDADYNAAGVAIAEPRLAPGGSRFGDGLISVHITYPGLTYPLLVEIAMHELGHIIGLGHAQRPDQIMYRTSNGETPTPVWGDGDRNGLALLGARQGCVVPVPKISGVGWRAKWTGTRGKVTIRAGAVHAARVRVRVTTPRRKNWSRTQTVKTSPTRRCLTSGKVCQTPVTIKRLPTGRKHVFLVRAGGHGRWGSPEKVVVRF